MHRISKLAWLLAPVLLTVTGCASKPAFISNKQSTVEVSGADRVERLLTVADKYEKQGNTEAAYHLYQQILTQSPTNTAARDRIARIDASQELRLARYNPDAGETSQSAHSAADANPARREEQISAPLATARTESRTQSEFFELLEVKRKHDEQLATNSSTAATLPHTTQEPTAPPANLPQVKARPERQVLITPATDVPDAPASRVKVAQTSAERTVIRDTPDFSPPTVAVETENAWDHTLSEEPEVRHTRVPTDENGWKPVIIPHSMTQSVSPEDLPRVPVPVPDMHRQTVSSAPTATQVYAPLQPVTSAKSSADSLAAELIPAVGLLSSPDPVQRISGLVELGMYGNAARGAAIDVRPLLADSNPLVRAHAAGTIIDVEGASLESMRCLHQLLTEDDDQVVQLAAYLLGKIGPAAMEAVEQLEHIRDTRNGLTQLHAAEAIIRIAPHEPRSLIVITSALRSGNRGERYFSAVALGGIAGTDRRSAAESLRLALHDEQAEIRAAAALSLGALGESAMTAIADLEHMAQYDFTEVKSAAQTTLDCLAQYRQSQP